MKIYIRKGKNIQVIEKDYSKIEDMIFSSDWNTRYIGRLMEAELRLDDPDLEETLIFSDNQSYDLKVTVDRDAQIQMHIWYSILKDKRFLKDFSDKHKFLLIEKAKYNWTKLVEITKGLKSSENLIKPDNLKSEQLTWYRKTRQGQHAYKIKMDKSNRFVYLPIGRVGRNLKVFSCMLHLNDRTKDRIIRNDPDRVDNFTQGILELFYRDLDYYLPKTIDSKFRSVVKVDYLSEMFKGNSKYINLI